MDFFDRLVADPPAGLRHLDATIRFDLDDAAMTRHWLLTLNGGTLTVAHRKARADAVIHTNQRLFERMVAGQANAMAATLRGEITVEGNPELLVAFQRILPGPPGGHHA